ncbi:hypothetical protein [Mycobacterium riyadhense]|nr:hypothetical protein [Mycobacterium riyadhense]MCV7144849.1 hypothetical protein [Mycobacterium riyadhense]
MSWILQSKEVSWREAVLTIPERRRDGITNRKMALVQINHCLRDPNVYAAPTPGHQLKMIAAQTDNF